MPDQRLRLVLGGLRAFARSGWVTGADNATPMEEWTHMRTRHKGQSRHRCRPLTINDTITPCTQIPHAIEVQSLIATRPLKY